MANKKVNWDSPETWQRVVASMIATGIKVDLKATALYFDTTYDTLENRFRKIKKEAAVLKTEAEAGERSGEIAGLGGARSNPSTPNKPAKKKNDVLGAVSSGRVAKSTPTPRRKKTFKQEIDGFDATDMLENEYGHGMSDCYGPSGEGAFDMF